MDCKLDGKSAYSISKILEKGASRHWKEIARRLNFKEHEILTYDMQINVRMEPISEIFIQILYKWIERESDQATPTNLNKELIEMDLKNTAEEIKKIYAAKNTSNETAKVPKSSGSIKYMDEIKKWAPILAEYHYLKNEKELFFFAIGKNDIWEDNENKPPEIAYYNALRSWHMENPSKNQLDELCSILERMNWNLVKGLLRAV